MSQQESEHGYTLVWSNIFNIPTQRTPDVPHPYYLLWLWCPCCDSVGQKDCSKSQETWVGSSSGNLRGTLRKWLSFKLQFPPLSVIFVAWCFLDSSHPNNLEFCKPSCHFIFVPCYETLGKLLNMSTFWQVKVLVAQSCQTLCNPWTIASVLGISQARILEWVAIPFFRGSSWPRDGALVSGIVGRFFFVWATREA